MKMVPLAVGIAPSFRSQGIGFFLWLGVNLLVLVGPKWMVDGLFGFGSCLSRNPFSGLHRL